MNVSHLSYQSSPCRLTRMFRNISSRCARRANRTTSGRGLLARAPWPIMSDELVRRSVELRLAHHYDRKYPILSDSDVICGMWALRPLEN